MQDNNNIDNQFTDFAWGEMSKVLDKEMPQKKRNRTLFFWLFGFAMLAGVSFLFLNSYNGKNENSSEVASLGLGEKVIAESNESVQSPTLKEDTPMKEIKSNEIVGEKIQRKEEAKRTNSQENALMNTGASTLPVKQPTTQSTNQGVVRNIDQKKVVKNNLSQKEYNEKQVVKNESTIINTVKTKIVKESAKKVLENTQIEKTETIQEEIKLEKQIAKEKDTSVDLAKENEPSNVGNKEMVEALVKQTVEKEEPIIKEQVEESTLDESLAKETNKEDSKIEEAEERVESTKDKKWSFGVNTIVYVNKDFEYINDWVSYAFVKRDLSNKFALSIGLGYTNFLFKNSKINDEIRFDSDDMTMPELGSDPSTIGGDMDSVSVNLETKSTIRKHFFNVPLALHYNINKKIGLETGIGFEFLLNSVEDRIVKEINPYYHAGFNFYLNDKINLGISYKLLGARFENNNIDKNQNIPATNSSFEITYPDLVLKNYNHLFGLKLGYTF